MKKYDSKNDQSKKRSIGPVITVLIVIFLLLLSGIVFLRYGSNIHLNNFSFKKASINDNLKNQLDNQKGEKEVQIRLSEDDVNKLLNTDAPDFPLKSPSVKITPEKIILSGKTGNSPLSFKVEVGIIPQALNGKVNFDIKEIKTAGVSAPKVVTDKVNRELSSYLKQYSPSEDIKISEVKLYNSYLVITGERVE